MRDYDAEEQLRQKKRERQRMENRRRARERQRRKRRMLMAATGTAAAVLFVLGIWLMIGRTGTAKLSKDSGETVQEQTTTAVPDIGDDAGDNSQDVEQDLEGLQTMRALGRNMAWLLSCIEAGQDAGINPPAVEPFQRTNFIR